MRFFGSIYAASVTGTTAEELAASPSTSVGEAIVRMGKLFTPS
jgi:hypothetical protein